MLPRFLLGELEESSKLAQKVITACKGVSSVKSCSQSSSLLFDAYVVKGDALSGLGSTEQVHTQCSHITFSIFLPHSFRISLSLFLSLSFSLSLSVSLSLFSLSSLSLFRSLSLSLSFSLSLSLFLSLSPLLYYYSPLPPPNLSYLLSIPSSLSKLLECLLIICDAFLLISLLSERV